MPSSEESFKADKVSDFVKVSTERLKDRGFRITGPRSLVIEALSRSNQPLTAQSLYEMIIESGEKIDVVSVYRILSAFKELDLVHHIGIVDGYVACTFHDEHLGETQHIVCDNCGKVWELPLSTVILDETKRVLESRGMAAHNVKVEILATCEDCLN